MRGAHGGRTLSGDGRAVPSHGPQCTAPRPCTSSRGTSTSSQRAHGPGSHSEAPGSDVTGGSDASYGISVSYRNQPSPSSSSSSRVVIRLQNHHPASTKPAASSNPACKNINNPTSKKTNTASQNTNLSSISTASKTKNPAPGPRITNTASTNTSSAGESASTPVKRSTPASQFIKRSGSVEIKRGSSSPRNSYVSVCDSVNSTPSPRKPDPTASTTAAASSSTPTSSCSSGPVDSPTLERSPLLKADQSTPPPGSAEVAVTWTRGSKPFRIPTPADAPSTGTPEGTANTAPSAPPAKRSPPQTLPIIPVAGSSGTVSAAPTGDNQNDNRHGDQSKQPNSNNRLHAGGASRLSSSSSSNSSSSRPSVSSPLSPGHGVQVMPRSGSVASQVSQFSVCSETGEKKRPKFSLVPIVIGNDAPYPASNVSHSNTRDPGSSADTRGTEKRTHGSPASNLPSTSHGAVGSSQTPLSPASSGSSAVSSPPGEEEEESDTLMASATSPSASDSLDSRGSTLDRAGTRAGRRGSGTPTTPATTSTTVTNSNMVDLSAINNNYVVSNHGNCEDRMSPGHRSSCPDDRPSVRKAKQRKRSSRGKENAGSVVNGVTSVCDSLPGDAVTPARISYVTEDGLGTQSTPTGGRVSENPANNKHVSRRSCKGREYPSTPKFKQYGFIDDPELLTNRDATAQNGHHHHQPGNKSLHRQNSKERSQNGTDRRQSSRDKSKSRENSRERRKRSGSRDRNVHKMDNDTTTTHAQRERRHGAQTREDNLDNAMFINGDAAGSRNRQRERRKHPGDHHTGSSSLERRRKRRSTGDRTFPDSESQGQGHHKHSQTAPALNGYHHDNEDAIVIVDNNDDDVFISNHSNEPVVDNIHHYPTKGRCGARTNRHSVPNMDNNRTLHLDR